MKKIKYINLLKIFNCDEIHHSQYFFYIIIKLYIIIMKEHHKELVIIPLNQNEDGTKFTANILYNNYLVGIFQLEKNTFPPVSEAFGSPYNTQYEYTLIFNKKENKFDESLNIAMDSIQTNGFFKVSEGIFIINDLGLPLGTYINIGISPEGIRYNLELINEDNNAKIMLKRIC